ncbi:Bro-N domain-containing protein [Robinsoniella sp.]|uniref:BRO-N domain-containing protein n=1 Tax=Robinsoniella sp. TaxID=2496533 RepID=UPI0037507A7E
MKTENWNGCNIRFVEKDGEWWAVAKDVAIALGYKHTPQMVRNLDQKDKGVHKVDTLGGKQELSIISEFGIYDATFGSHKKEAKEFKRWVFSVIKTLRQSTGLEGFQIFRMLDKEHQKETMSKLCKTLRKPVQVDFIKANIIANKAVSTRFGFPKMVKKAEMTPEMLIDRQELLESAVDLMGVKEKFQLNISVSDEVYKMANNSNRQAG